MDAKERFSGTMSEKDQERERIERIERDFTYHPTRAGQGQRYIALRNGAKDLALAIIAMTPVSREQSLALTNLEQAIFWANAAIARNE